MKYLVLFLLLPVLPAVAQVNSQSQEAVARNFIAAYNAQDFVTLFNIFPEPLADLEKQRKVEIEVSLKKEFQSQFSDLGKIMIDSVFMKKPRQVTVAYHYQNDPIVPSGIILFFDTSGIVQGIQDKQPDFAYPKVTTAISSAMLSRRGQLIDSVVRDRFVKDKFNGNVLVVDGGKTILHKSYGYSNFEKKIPLNDNSLFELASCSKQFTAMAIMILAEEGKLNYSDSLQRFIPELPYHGITIESLLTHTSGLPDYMGLLAEHWDDSKVAFNQDIVESFKTYKPDVRFQPNDK